MGLTPDAVSWAFRVPGLGIDALSDALDIAGITAAGLSEEDGVSTAWFTTDDDAPPQRRMPVDGRWEAVPAADWSERWKAGLRPVTIGSITVSPPWLAPDGPATDVPPYTLVIEPGMAFGTGHHETTTACLATLQEIDLAGRHVVDVGTGTGVLGLAARVLGAGRVTAVDTDPEAVEVAAANLALHGLDGITLHHGSTEAVDGPADVVVANIITDLLMALAPALVGLLRPGGTLLCCGVAVNRVPEAVSAFAAAGLRPVARPGREWAVLLGTR